VSVNLLVVLVVAGIIAAAAIHWFLKGGDGRRTRSGRGRGGAAAGKNEPALSTLGGIDDIDGIGGRGGQNEIPLLDTPEDGGSGSFRPGVAVGGYGDSGDYGDHGDFGEHSHSDGDAHADRHAAHEFPADTVDNAADDFAPATVARTAAGNTVAVADPPSQFRHRPVDGFDRLSQIDFWAKITGARDVGRETVLALYHDGAAGLHRTHSIHGLKMPEKVWRNLEDEAEDSRFADLVVTLQLADRRGPVDAAEMTRFSNLVSKLSEGTGREFQFMTTTENALAQAAAVAAFAAHFDSVFVVNISPNPGAVEAGGARFHGDAIDRLAPRMGLERDHNRHYARFKQVGKERVRLYALADRSDTGRFDFRDMQSFTSRGLVFFTKPAVNRSPGAVFAEMVDTAKAFAARMHGVVDSPNDGGRGDLSQDEVESIRRAIEQLAADMTRAGIAPGGDEAARLFA